MNILTSYTLKYLRLNRKRTVVTILGVVLSSALICGVILLGASFQKVMIDHEIFTAGNWHAQFLAVPYAKAKHITENSAVQTSMFSSWLGNATYGSHNPTRPYLYITAYDAPSFQNQSIKLISGRLPQHADELLVSPVMVADSGLGLKPGSTLQVTFGQRNIPNHDEMVKAWGGEEYVAENISLPLLLDGRSLDEARLKEIVATLGLADRIEHLPNQLSGGQQQRVSIGRALINTPALILADEPTGNLDSRNSQEIIALLKLSNQRYHQTLIMVTHDREIALQADRIISFGDGRIVRDEVVRA